MEQFCMEQKSGQDRETEVLLRLAYIHNRQYLY